MAASRFAVVGLVACLCLLPGLVPLPGIPPQQKSSVDWQQTLTENDDSTGVLLGALDFISTGEIRDEKLAAELGQRLFDRCRDAYQKKDFADGDRWQQHLAELYPDDPVLDILQIFRIARSSNEVALNQAVDEYAARYQREGETLLVLASWLYYRVDYGYRSRERRLFELALSEAAPAQLESITRQIVDFQQKRFDLPEARRLLNLAASRGLPDEISRELEMQLAADGVNGTLNTTGRSLLILIIFLLVWRYFGRNASILLLFLLPLVLLERFTGATPLLPGIVVFVLLIQYREKLIFFLAAYYHAHGGGILAGRFLGFSRLILTQPGRERSRLLEGWLLLRDNNHLAARRLCEALDLSETLRGELASLDAAISLAEGRLPRALRLAAFATRSTREAGAWETLVEGLLRLGDGRRVRFLLAGLQSSHSVLEICQARAARLDGDENTAISLTDELLQKSGTMACEDRAQLWWLHGIFQQGESRRNALKMALAFHRDEPEILLRLLYETLDSEFSGEVLEIRREALQARPQWGNRVEFRALEIELAAREMIPPLQEEIIEHRDGFMFRALVHAGNLSRESAESQFCMMMAERARRLQRVAWTWEDERVVEKFSPVESWERLELEAWVLLGEKRAREFFRILQIQPETVSVEEKGDDQCST